MNENILYPSREPKRCSTINSLAILLVFLTYNIILIPVNAEDGSSLHAENCIACHAAMTGGDGSVLYTRDDRNVDSLDALSKQIDRCQSSLDLNWSSDQISSVQQYLNKSFYEF